MPIRTARPALPASGLVQGRGRIANPAAARFSSRARQRFFRALEQAMFLEAHQFEELPERR
ncbi:MAG TPA: hypothetical protein VFD82_10795 [Planctomycetota bacterium]|nr:hypothetical protein [Planctomycetota bacterium]